MQKNSSGRCDADLQQMVFCVKIEGRKREYRERWKIITEVKEMEENAKSEEESFKTPGNVS